MKPSDNQNLLTNRSGIPTYVYTIHGEMLFVKDVFWLQDDDDEYPYSITNSNTDGEQLVSNSFYSNEIVKIIDYRTHEVLFER